MATTSAPATFAQEHENLNHSPLMINPSEQENLPNYKVERNGLAKITDEEGKVIGEKEIEKKGEDSLNCTL
ncbi:hypothetical protein [Saccharibacillus kuerlensis]|nr:hypothetical protein [Saccharibacillus kuerlensis]